jgi:hypothetical protein
MPDFSPQYFLAFIACIVGTFWRVYPCKQDRKTAEIILLQAKSSILDLENGDYGLLEII